MDDDDQNNASLDVDEWLRKFPGMKKAVEKDVAVTQQSVDDTVRKLQCKIENRKIEITLKLKRMDVALIAAKKLKSELQRKEQEIERYCVETSKLSDANQRDETRIDAIKTNHQEAQDRLRKVEETFQALGSMLPKPTAEARETSTHPEPNNVSDGSPVKRPVEDDLAGESPLKRQRSGADATSDNALGSRSTTTYAEVYDGGRTTREIVECPDTKQYLVLTCAEHNIKFGDSAFAKAIEHARDGHGLNLTPQGVCDMFGVPVLECRSWHARRNNTMCRTNQFWAKRNGEVSPYDLEWEASLEE